MRLDYIIQAIESEPIKIKSTDFKTYISIINISDYLKVISYHTKDKEVYELEVLAVVGHNENYHYLDTIKVADICTNLMTNLTKEQRLELYQSINLGEMNKVVTKAGNSFLNYQLGKNGLLTFRISCDPP